MSSKQVIDRGRSAAHVRAQVETHADELHSALKEQLSPHLERGEKMPDVALLTRLMGRYLAANSDALTSADKAHEAELSDDGGPRQERDAAEADLRESVSAFRDTVSTHFGAAGLRALGLWDPAPADTRGLERYAADFVAALEDSARKLTGKQRKSVKIDRHEMAKELAPEVKRLSAALAIVTKEEAELSITQTAKNKALAANDAAFTGVARTAEGLLTLAGRADLAGRVRPSTQRPGIAQSQEAPTAETPDPTKKT